MNDKNIECCDYVVLEGARTYRRRPMKNQLLAMLLEMLVSISKTLSYDYPLYTLSMEFTEETRGQRVVCVFTHVCVWSFKTHESTPSRKSWLRARA